jgi:hypothetical protein
VSATHRFIDSLISQVPELRPLLDEHLRDNDQLLPHVFMGDLTRFVVDLHADAYQTTGAAEASLLQILKEILTALEAAMESGDEDVKELIAVSFLENLDPDSPNYKELKSLFGEDLLKQLAMYESI